MEPSIQTHWYLRKRLDFLTTDLFNMIIILFHPRYSPYYFDVLFRLVICCLEKSYTSFGDVRVWVVTLNFFCLLGLYNTTFRPIGGGDYPLRGGESPNPNPSIHGNNNGSYATLVPTPIRGSRPPLLATPPGYYGKRIIHLSS